MQLGFGEGVSSSHMEEWSGEMAVSLSSEFFFIFEFKMGRFGAFLVLFFYSSTACFTRKITEQIHQL